MTESEGIYQRLGREQQEKAQRVVLWFVAPLCGLLGVFWLVTEGPDRYSVGATVFAGGAFAATLYDAWRTRRGLPSLLWREGRRE